MGEVFLAEVSGEHGFRKMVAVKRILEAGPDAPRNRDDSPRGIIAEAKLAVSLTHANLVQVLDLARAADVLFMVMEFVHGADLARLLAAAREKGRPIAVGVALGLVAQALSGLAYAHERVDFSGHPCGVLHCDLSPSNLLVSYAGEVKIADFGVAQVLRRSRTTDGGRVVGKYRYMAPEMLRGESVDVRADLYSLGLVLFETLSLERLFEGSRSRTGEQSSPAAPADRLRGLRSDIPAALEECIARVLSPDPAERYPSARSMLAEISAIARTVEPVITPPDLGAWARSLVPPDVVTPRSPLTRALDRLFDNESSRTVSPEAPARRTVSAGPSTSSSARSFVTRTDRDADGTMVWEPRTAPRRDARFGGSKRATAIGVGAIGAALTIILVGGAVRIPSQAAATSTASASAAELSEPPAAPASVARGSQEAASPTTEEQPHPQNAESRPLARRAHSLGRDTSRRVGFLNVNAEPWAYVVVDGKSVGTTPMLELPLSAGRHVIRLEKPGARAMVRTVVIATGQTYPLDVDLAHQR
jgi:serine/threonine protein kinase